MVPDRSTLDAEAIAVHGIARLTCSNSTLPSTSPNGDRYYLQRLLSTFPNCGSVQTFRNVKAGDDFNRDLLFAGIFIRAALAVLLQNLGNLLPERRDEQKKKQGHEEKQTAEQAPAPPARPDPPKATPPTP
jgi:hypothetical protein